MRGLRWHRRQAHSLVDPVHRTATPSPFKARAGVGMGQQWRGTGFEGPVQTASKQAALSVNFALPLQTCRFTGNPPS